MSNLAWETVDVVVTSAPGVALGMVQQSIYVLRAPIPAGWLVMTYLSANTPVAKSGMDTSVTFVPDVGHEWRLNA